MADEAQELVDFLYTLRGSLRHAERVIRTTAVPALGCPVPDGAKVLAEEIKVLAGKIAKEVGEPTLPG